MWRSDCRAGSTVSPVVAGQRNARQREGVDEVEQVLSDRRLLGHARRRRVEQTGRSVAAQVGYEDAVAGGGKCRGHLVPGSLIVGEAVQEDDGEASRIAVRLVGDLQAGCEDRERHYTHSKNGTFGLPRR
jgi:hypothetical protein